MLEEIEIAKENLAKKMAGEICLAENPGKTIKKWRNIMKVPQRRLAEEIGVMPSVISDYESGRRRSPGIRVISKIVNGLISIDESFGGKIIKEFANFPQSATMSSVVLDIREFTQPVSIRDFAKAINGKIMYLGEGRDVYGYTVIDSLKAIVEFSPTELVKLYGLTTERALIFTKVETGRSPFVAIKVTNLRPGLVVLHGSITKIDEIALRIAEAEHIPVVISKAKDIKTMVERLRKRFS